jgi:hypothetical protein
VVTDGGKGVANAGGIPDFLAMSISIEWQTRGWGVNAADGGSGLGPDANVSHPMAMAASSLTQVLHALQPSFEISTLQ